MRIKGKRGIIYIFLSNSSGKNLASHSTLRTHVMTQNNELT